MRFLADMGISPRTVDFLRDAGHDAIHLLERGLHELGDPDILKLAHEEERMLLVHDLDFSDLVAASGGEVPSVVVFRLRDMRPASVNAHLKRVLERHPEELESGAIFSVTRDASDGDRFRLTVTDGGDDSLLPRPPHTPSSRARPDAIRDRRALPAEYVAGRE